MAHSAHDCTVGNDFTNKTQKSPTLSEKMINIIALKLSNPFLKRQGKKPANASYNLGEDISSTYNQ